jgi:hypothetical protein
LTIDPSEIPFDRSKLGEKADILVLGQNEVKVVLYLFMFKLKIGEYAVKQASVVCDTSRHLDVVSFVLGQCVRGKWSQYCHVTSPQFLVSRTRAGRTHGAPTL